MKGIPKVPKGLSSGRLELWTYRVFYVDWSLALFLWKIPEQIEKSPSHNTKQEQKKSIFLGRIGLPVFTSIFADSESSVQ